MNQPAPIGLSTTQAQKKLIQIGPNLIPDQQSRTSLKIFLSILKEPMVALLVISSAIYYLIGDLIEAILLSVMVGFVSLITFVQEKKTENALASLKKLSDPKVKVIRDGREQIISSHQLVPGDVVKVSEGDRIPADGQLLHSFELYVDEAAITGESLPVHKKDSHVVYSGSLITSGWAYLKVTHTGINTKIGEIGTSLATITEIPTRMQVEIRRLMYFFAAIGFVACAIAIIGIWLTTADLIHALLQGIAIAMSLLPEELPVVITIFTALGALRIAKQRVLMTNLPTLETLGSATVLCTDKTGTLTQNKMTVTGIITPDNQIETPYRSRLSSSATTVLKFARAACHTVISDSMEQAIDDAYRAHIPDKLPSITQVSSLKQNRLFMINLIELDRKHCLFVAKGAPEAILNLCDLAPSLKKSLTTLANSVAREGSRLLAVATSNNLDGNYNYTYMGMIILSDPLRPHVHQAIQECYQAGIRVIMITGDYPETARAIGKSIGLVGNHNLLTGNEIETMNIQELRRRLKATNICARILPSQKLRIVEALKHNGEIVAMTGDGVNDAPALKAAHMGIAMGLKGTDVARESADMILTDDNFVSIVKAIKGGRRIFTNIRKAIGFIIAVHIPIALLATIPSFLNWPLILTPVHIVILELLIDPVCTLVFENEPAEPDIMRRPPRSSQEKIVSRLVLTRALFSGVFVSLAVFAAYLTSMRLFPSAEEVRTTAFLTLIFANIGLVLSYRSDKGTIIKTIFTKNPAFWIVTLSISIITLGLVTLTPLQSLFKFSPLSPPQTLIIASYSLLSLFFEIVFTRFSSKLRNKYT